MNSFMSVIDPILYDLKHGNLKRVAKSNFERKNTMFFKARVAKSEANSDSFKSMTSSGSITEEKE